MRFLYTTALLLISSIIIHSCINSDDKLTDENEDLGNNISSRRAWELNRLADPATGNIPPNMAELEHQFASYLPNDFQIKAYRSSNWTHRGPFFIGGRTRAFAMDINDSNILIAGGVSGGLWRSENGGKSWYKTTLPAQLHNSSCLIQDKRKGKTNVWYCGTGEAYGNSAYASGAYFYGNGMLKSTDNGKTWFPLTSTTTINVTDFDPWDLIWNIATDNSNDTQDVVYAATLRRLYKSIDGGQNWNLLMGSDYGSYFTDVAVTSSGIVYTAMSKDGNQAGIWRSADGQNFVNILPKDTFPAEYNRIVIGIDPNNENVVYFLAHSPGYGKLSLRSRGEEDWNSLWKYRFLKGDGSSNGGRWENLSQNIPSDGSRNFNNFNAQGGYNLIVAVMPGDSNKVFIGGTNLYRSSDAFRSDTMTVQMGGYGVNTKRPNWKLYENHHPDQHVFFFDNKNSNIVFNGNDGGIFKTFNCLADSVKWTSLNNGYLTTQMYTCGIETQAASDIIIAGLQDNGNLFVNSKNPEAKWEVPYNADGSYGAIARNKDFYIMSIQLGRIRKLKLDNEGKVLEYSRIDPQGASNYLFINPLVLDPNNNNLLYMAEGAKIWRNDSITHIPYTGSNDSIKMGWKWFKDTVEFPNRAISALGISTSNPTNRLYVGTNKSVLYRIDDAHTGEPEMKRITSLVNAGNIDTLLGTATNWIQFGKNSIGNMVVDMVVSRSVDGLVVAATHGNGIYSTYATSVEDILGTKEDKLFLNENIKVFPTAASNSVTIAIRKPQAGIQLEIYDVAGKKMLSLKPEISMNQQFYYQSDISAYKKGMYFVRLVNGNKTETITFIKY